MLELAMTLPLVGVFLGLLLFYGMALYRYECAAKAAHDAARYLSSVRQVEMKSYSLVTGHLSLAQEIIKTEMGAIASDPSATSLTILCGALVCDGYTLPATVTVSIRLRVTEQALTGFTMPYLQSDVILQASSTMPYVGL